MNVAARSLAVLLILAAPFGEGGRQPGALALLHSAALVLILLAAIETLSRVGAGRPRGSGAGLLLLPAASLLLACLSAARAGYPYAAWLAMMDRFTVIGAFFAAALLLRASADLSVLRGAAVISTTVQALHAFQGWWGGGPAGAADLFLNRNHLAAYLNLGMFLCVAAAAGERTRGARRASALWASAGAAHLAASLLLQSRGGLAGLSIGGGLFILLLWPRLTARSRAACVLGFLLVLVTGGWLVYLRFARNEDPDRFARLSIWEAGLAMAWERPLLGVGPGGFPHEAQRYNFPRPSDPVRFARSFQGAHSVLVTYAAEDGIPAALLLLAGALGAMGLLWRRPGEGRVADAALGTALATAALMAQGLVEDLQQRPALMLTSALLLGSALASTRGWQAARRPAPRRAPVAAALALAAFWVALGGITRPLHAWRLAQYARSSGRAGLPAMRHAAAIDPWNAEYHHDLAMAALNSASPGPEPYAEARSELEEARRRKPRDPRFPLFLARLEARGGRLVFDDPSRDGAAAALYAEAARLAPTDPRPHLERAGHLAGLGRPEEAQAVLDGALSIEPHYRRARILKTALLLRLGRISEAQASYAELLASDRALGAYQPDSGYASEIVSDAPAERAALESALKDSQGPFAAGTTP